MADFASATYLSCYFAYLAFIASFDLYWGTVSIDNFNKKYQILLFDKPVSSIQIIQIIQMRRIETKRGG